MGLNRYVTDKVKVTYLKKNVSLYNKSIIKAKAQKPLGIMSRFIKENKKKLGEASKKSGRKSNRVRIAKVGVKLVESG